MKSYDLHQDIYIYIYIERERERERETELLTLQITLKQNGYNIITVITFRNDYNSNRTVHYTSEKYMYICKYSYVGHILLHTMV